MMSNFLIGLVGFIILTVGGSYIGLFLMGVQGLLWILPLFVKDESKGQQEVKNG